jgi:hypothetical protein
MRSGAAAAFPRRSWTPLALTLGLHLLLVLAWVGGSSRGVVREPERRALTLVLVRAALPPPPPETAGVSPPRVRLRAPSSLYVQPGEPAAPAPSELLETPPTEAQATALPGDLLATSKRMAGAVDRELRKGSSPITAEPERKWERFAEAVAGAHVNAVSEVTLDSYTAGDGVVVYRKTVGGRTRCYQSGSVGGLGPADGRSAGSVACPSGASWKRL